MKNLISFLIVCIINLTYLHSTTNKIVIVGGGIVGALEAYSAYRDAQNEGKPVFITIYEKGESLSKAAPSDSNKSSTNTSYNITPSLTPDEILSVVPRGSELMNKLAILFSEPGGIRVDDVPGVNDSASAMNFKKEVAIYGTDKNHDDRTQTLLMLGKKSMDLWQEMYDHADDELKDIMIASNFNPCREQRNKTDNTLHDGYRIDLIYGIPNAKQRALGMKADYEKLGYTNCTVLSPEEVIAIDPYLADFCNEHSDADDTTMKRKWKNDSVALWRPGGCLDAHAFLPQIYDYLKKKMGQSKNASGIAEDCFCVKFSHEVVGVELGGDTDQVRIVGLKFNDGTKLIDQGNNSKYVFCTGEAIGTLHKLGFSEPAFAAFAGPSLFLKIPISDEQLKAYKNFSHCMEVHNEGIVLAWQSRVKGNLISIGVSGTKSFYGEKRPNKDEAFAKNRNLVQLNMINDVLPEFVSLALGYNTKGKELNADEMTDLEQKGIAHRWVGRRAVAYDGFPTYGPLYSNNRKVVNARCTTHLGSGGVSFGPASVMVSRASEKGTDDAFIKKVLMYADSKRTAEIN